MASDEHDAPHNIPLEESVSFVRSEIARWKEKRLISPVLARRLLSEYAPRGKPVAAAVPAADEWPSIRVPMTAGMVLLYIGGLLVVVAAIMLVSEVWKDLGNWERFLMVLLPTGALYGGGACLRITQPLRRVTGDVLIFFACLLVPLATWLGVACVMGAGRHLSEGQSAYVALCSVGVHALTLYLFRSPVLTIPLPLTFIWLVVEVSDAVMPKANQHSENWIGAALVIAGLVLVGVAMYAASIKRHAYAVMPDLAGSVCAQIGLLFLGSSGHKLGWELTALLVSIGFIALSVALKNQIYLMIGALFLVINTFVIGFEYFQHDVGLPATLLICGLLSIAVGYVVQRVRREYVLEEE